MTAKLASVLLFVLGLIVAGCGSGPGRTAAVPTPAHTSSASQGPTIAVHTPTPAPTVDRQPALDTALAFVQAFGDWALVDSYMGPSRRSSGSVYFPPLPAHEIQDAQCHPSSVPLLAPNQVVVSCSFTFREDWDGHSAGSGYGEYVWLSPQPDGTWLVYDSGN
jgi:hypothetical protein